MQTILAAIIFNLIIDVFCCNFTTMIIGLTGTNASGKTCIIRYLTKKKFEYHSLSDIIRDELTMRTLEHSRDNLRQVGNELREKFGSSVLADRVITTLNSENCVIDSIRNTFEVKALRDLNNFHLIALDAPIEIRYRRSMGRGRIENAPNIEAFKTLEDKEKSKDHTAQNIDQCIEMANFKIYNDGSIEDLYQKIELVLQKINK